MEETKKARKYKISDETIAGYFRFYRKTVPGKEVKRSTFYAVLRDVNKMMVDDLISGRTVFMPFLGKARVEKFEASPQFKGIDYNHYNTTGEKVHRYRPHLLECYAPKLAWKRNLSAHPYCKDFSFRIIRRVWRDEVLSLFKIEGGHRKFIEYI